MESRMFGYVRVSSKDQNEERQVRAMLDYGIEKRDIFIDKKSGANFDREQYNLMKKVIRENDVLVVQSIDRFGRNYEMIVDEWKDITKNIGADIVVLDIPLLDTRQKDNGLMGKVISQIVLELLGFCAENDRQNIKKRQADGIQVARAKGVQFGRPRVIRPTNFETVVKRYKNGEITRDEALTLTNLRQNTFYNFLKEM